ncbi:MAG: CPBP family intramembrane metalloprotease [Deltaproteobacteria bacterium]|nr:CPBP family intramembrane metalloprotease [Deltaproteobacteria bacterium]NND28968.1 CPBP family intramembrane metalloprotease [Myxococcales bacterium]MBT8483011.1 CPBP family intramembrane metalloprotease [Deltaproteobacteria bacterium]NNK07949.1 CPBP family intramembrane metalloprotease [Myxococcales bacterium]NNK44202.1 CPBP family intramembrane metalloprotease [Myxococcales bacterium]
MGRYLKAFFVALAFPALMHLFLALGGFLQLRSSSASWGEAINVAGDSPLNLALVQAAATGVLFIVAFPHRRREGGLLESVEVRPLVGGIVALCFLAGAFMQLPLAEVGNLVQEVWPLSFDELARRYRMVNPSTWWAGMSISVALVIVAPVTEELLFRGWLLQDLKEPYGDAPALIWSSLLFGLVHAGGGVSAIVYGTLGGLVLGAVALRTKSTLSSIAMHAGVNALPLLLPASLLRVDGFNTLSQEVEHISGWLVLLALAGAGAALSIVWRGTSEPSG